MTLEVHDITDPISGHRCLPKFDMPLLILHTFASSFCSVHPESIYNMFEYSKPYSPQ
jgi:hypothetical protein